ncbi:MAG TPA: AsmA-like C-terminal region-containing protein [Methylomirabilota bacterium]|nr:AsmA-like C-terminal region-containing protein [Methylomirabilota bacterium]
MKWVLAVIATVVILTAVAIAALPRLVDVPRVQALIATNASQALGRPVRFASVSVSVFPLPGVTLHQLEVAEDPQFGGKPFLTLDRGRLRLRIRPLLSGRIEFAELSLAKPVITVMRDARGRLNVATLGATSEPRPASRSPRSGSGGGGGTAALALPGSVKISDGVLMYVAEGAGAAPATYRVEHLDLVLDAAGPQIAFKGSARVMPGDLALKFTDGIVTVTPGQTLTGAPLRANVTLESANMSPLVASAAGPTLGVGGALKGALAVAGTVGAPTASGDITLSKLTVARTSPRCPEPKRRTLTVPSLSLKAAWRPGTFSAQPIQAELAKGTVNARLTADLERGARVRFDDLAVKALPLESVLVDFLCQGYAVTGPLDLAGALAFATARPLETLSGPGSFKIGAGKIVGRDALKLVGNVVRVGGTISSLLNADLPPTLFSSPVEFDSITGTYRITDGVATTRDLLYTSRAMKVAVAGDYVLASGAMNVDMVVNHGRGEVRARLTGTSASPSIRIVPSSVLRGIDQDKVETGLRDLLKRFR